MSGKKIVVFLVSLVFVFIVCLGFGMNNASGFKDIFTNTTALENTNYLVQIIVGVSVVIGAIIGVWQYVLTARCERAKISNERIEKAIKLSEYYKDFILPKYTLVYNIFEISGIKEILDEVTISSSTNFDKVELGNLLKKSNINKISQIMESEKMARIILKADNIYGVGLDKERLSRIEYDTHGNAIINTETKEWLTKVMSRIVNHLLNNVEYFAMNFTHGVADESVVYQSLHQTYLEMIPMLYYNISKNNDTNGMQFYTNAVGLYKIWYNHNKAHKEKIAEEGRSVREGNKAEDV